MVEETAAQAAPILTPCGDRVVVALDPLPTEVGGVLLPPGRRVRYDAPRLGSVVDVGERVPAEIRPGARVYVAAQHDGLGVTMNGVALRIVGAGAIIAVVTERRTREAIRANAERLAAEWREAYPDEPFIGAWETWARTAQERDDYESGEETL